MRKRSKKVVSAFSAAALTLGTGIPAAYSATESHVSEVPMVSADDTGTIRLGTLTLLEEEDFLADLKPGRTFTLMFPGGVNIKNTTGDLVYINGEALTGSHVKIIGDHTVDVTLPTATSDAISSSNRELLHTNDQDRIEVKPLVEFDDFSGGNVEVKLEGAESGVTSGTFVLAKTESNNTTATILDTKSIGSDSLEKSGTLRISENFVGALGNESQELTLKLPKNFSWNFAKYPNEISFAKGLSNTGTIGVDSGNERVLRIIFNPEDNRTAMGSIDIPLYLKVENDADFGDITLEIDGDNVTEQDVVVGSYKDYGAAVGISEVKQVIAGSYDDSEKIGEITIKENTKGSLIPGRNVTIELPKGVKIVGQPDYSGSDLTGTINKDMDRITIPVPSNRSGGKLNIKFKLALAVEIGKYGPVEATIEGAGLKEQKLVIAKSVPPGIVKTEPAEAKIGMKEQPMADIILIETAKEAVKQSVTFINPATRRPVTMDGWIQVFLPKGVVFSSKPNVQVIEGDAKIDEGSVHLTTTADGEDAVQFDIKSESSIPSKIRISGVKINVDRTLPEGVLQAKITGTGLVNPASKLLFDTKPMEFDYIRVITPASNEAKLKGKFTISSKTYVINDKEKEMDVAPYIKNDRTYLPIRYVAEALGVTENNVVWDASSQTVSLFEGNKIVQLKVGSKVIIVNGTAINMDVSMEIKDERAMLPLRFVAEALGGQVTWDKESSTILID